MMGALPFVPIDDVDRAWRFLKSTLPSNLDTFVWKFLDALRLGQALTDIKITSHLTRKLLEPRSQKWVKHDQRINTVIESYDTYYDFLDYLKLLDV